MNQNQVFQTRLLSSLSKVFPDGQGTEHPVTGGSMLSNETYAFQAAYWTDSPVNDLKVIVDAPAALQVTVRRVGLVPSGFPVYPDHDEHVLRAEPGLFPDPLYPLDEDQAIAAAPGEWQSVWITLQTKGQTPAGSYPITVRFTSGDGEVAGEETFQLELIPEELPPQKLIHTEWFHADCLATYYNLDVFSKEHWQVIGQFIDTAVKHGMNMILTPVFTPPLDTEVGGERPTVQLVDVTVTGENQYAFGFDRLARWVELCDEKGIRYFEFSHLFTQWGAKHAPKIIASVDGNPQKIFGWETDATGEAYRLFLEQFVPALTEWIHANDLSERSYFHISDEPGADHLESYGYASKLLGGLLQGFPIIDALSDYDFFENGLVKTPIPASNHIEPFLEHNVQPLWTYYCCSQYKEVANRFMCFPSARNRILGYQLYKFDAAGFLHWGYNFYYSQYSKSEIDPYETTDAGKAFPSGDPFIVYPGPGGVPVESIRLEVMNEALQDLRALQLLESKIGRENVLKALEEDLPEPITFSRYPREEEWLIAKREWVNRKIKEALASANV
ncbi:MULTISPECIES: DUF4091 domain-containing protein [Paenibacillus]|nr:MULTISPECIES: DUF4091 domain-containing protein [Paenibacillus]MBJ9987767.1 DUF4091 domain-containing protein [Paenibacillus sp. S28]